jgi:hypothetical protein
MQHRFDQHEILYHSTATYTRPSHLKSPPSKHREQKLIKVPTRRQRVSSQPPQNSKWAPKMYTENTLRNLTIQSAYVSATY